MFTPIYSINKLLLQSTISMTFKEFFVLAVPPFELNLIFHY